MQNYLLVDTFPIFEINNKEQEWSGKRPIFDYQKLIDVLEKKGGKFTKKITFASIDFEHTGQMKFVSKLQEFGFDVAPLDFHINNSCLSSLSYMIGFLTGKLNEKSNICIVTNNRAIYYPILHAAKNHNITLAFFRKFMSYEWGNELNKINYINICNPEDIFIGMEKKKMICSGLSKI